MYQDTGISLQVQVVNGGFILNTFHDGRTEVFTSQAKLMKAIRAVIEKDPAKEKESDELIPVSEDSSYFQE